MTAYYHIHSLDIDDQDSEDTAVITFSFLISKSLRSNAEQVKVALSGDPSKVKEKSQAESDVEAAIKAKIEEVAAITVTEMRKV